MVGAERDRHMREMRWVTLGLRGSGIYLSRIRRD